MRLPAPGLRGTWARAYALLTRLVSNIGWDELLKTRSVVFVMEEEYRMQKVQNEPHGRQDSTSSQSVIHEDGSVLPSKHQSASQAATLVADANGGADDDASVRAVKESPTHKSRQASLAVADIPTIRISTESDGDREREAAVREAAEEAEQRSEIRGEEKEEEDTEESEDEDLTKVNGAKPVVHDTLEKPIQAAADNFSGTEDTSATPTTTTDPFSFSNKRLCERWLDNLFMVLYEVRFVSYGLCHNQLICLPGSAGLDHLQSRSRPLQDSTGSLQEDRDGVGDSWRPRDQA